MKKSFVVYKKYLKIPCDYTAQSLIALVTFQQENQDYIISYFKDGKDYAYINVERYKNRVITLECEQDIVFYQTNTYDISCQYKNRPLVHYTTPFGHINDPNGLFYKDGKYHLYYQCYPYSPSCKGNDLWSRQNWGYATTKDFIEYTYHGTPIHYNQNGAIWSGCAIVDSNNISHLGSRENPAVLYYWTLCGRQTPITKEKPFVQILSFSNDNGKTITYKGICLENVKGENRDPKVVFCEELNCYVMALFLDEPDLFGLFKSNDLINWQIFQELRVEGDRECPNLYPLNTVDGHRKWILSVASGSYLVGDFINDKFVPCQTAKKVYYSTFTTAHQVFDGQESLSISWLHIPFEDGLNFAGALTFPVKSTLMKIGEEFLLCQQPFNIEKLFKKVKLLPDGEQTLELKGKAYLLKLKLKASGVEIIKINNHICTIDFNKKTLLLNERQMPFDCQESLSLEIIIDRHCIELFAQNGLYNISYCKIHDRSQTKLILPKTAQSVKLIKLKQIKVKKEK